VGFFRVVVELPRRGVDGAECTRPPDHGVCVVVVGDDPANLQAVALTLFVWEKKMSDVISKGASSERFVGRSGGNQRDGPR
jgi:hypothetical protein